MLAVAVVPNPMSRYKGRAALKVIQSKFPEHVDMLLPEEEAELLAKPR